MAFNHNGKTRKVCVKCKTWRPTKTGFEFKKKPKMNGDPFEDICIECEKALTTKGK